MSNTSQTTDIYIIKTSYLEYLDATHNDDLG